MIPAVNSLKEIEVAEQPSLCHHMIRETCNVVGECDGLEAVKQKKKFMLVCCKKYF